MWNNVVNNAAMAMGHPGIAGAVRNLHPGVMPQWQGAGGIADWMSSHMPPQQPTPVGGAGSTPWAGGGWPARAPMQQPIAVGGGGSISGMQTPAPTGIAGYAAGGPVSGAPPDPSAPDPSMPDPNDPRVGAIADAEDALGTIEDGAPLEPHHIAALHHFNNTYGETALAHLHANVKRGLHMRERTGRMVTGQPGHDKVPAIVDHQQQAKLTSGEFVMPVDAVHGAGNGDPAVGAQKLQQLSAQLSALKPARQNAAAQPLPTNQPLNVEHVGS